MRVPLSIGNGRLFLVPIEIIFLDSAVVDHLNEGKPKGGQYQPNDDY